MSETKNILFFTDKISYSGASKIITWLVNNITLCDTQIFLATYLDYDDSRQVGSHVIKIKLNVPQKGKLKRSIEVIKHLHQIILEYNFSICIGFLPTECLYLQIAALGTGIPVIVCERSDPYMEKSLIAGIGRFCYRYAKGAVFQTEGAKEYFPKTLQEKGIIIPNPAFKSEVAYIPYVDREDVIAYSGRLFIRQKRQDLLLQVFYKVCEINPTVKLVIYGDGPDEELLKKKAASLGISERVVFAGKVTNVEEKISRCKLFAFTSDYEGIPNSIIEALQVGVPVVSMDCSPGGARALIENGKNGFIVERHDVNNMARRLLWLLMHETEAELFSKNALLVKDRFDEEKIIKHWRGYLYQFMRE